ncbi:Gfo/Idh/MocA family protein [Tepidibacillus fermentans]|uniref:Virulence factor n=1 Tax=Tepidibacillus fermentans TaxID=1281767 RepID=A0A4R3KIG3_9BACI|nr:Gfo/Idh/MocA family oxidoreductase [Tepidibacillus fermentans]TCS83269.1 virulence factor [Tepidibacillus fermentans]
MKIGVIGLGDIAEKAYLPVISTIKGIDIVFVTRNNERLNFLADKYRVTHRLNHVDELIDRNVDAAFVHSATEAHVPIIEKLLKNKIHVYVDKPISYSMKETREIIQLAKDQNVKFMVGFNRRYAPMYKNLQTIQGPKIIIMQKNRVNKMKEIREVIYDDFIHVVDTLRFLSGDKIEEIDVDSFIQDGKLHQLVVKFKGKDFTSIGMTNRDHGVNEEVLEYIVPKKKWVVRNLLETIQYENGEEKRFFGNDWEPTLYRRGFIDIINEFIDIIREDRSTTEMMDDALKTHEICEMIIENI